ncbi:hypothetical protein H4S00_002008 [Coemansia sp. D1744]|nr:hypothetical protein H4S00_002008 [Coemansia sp. D1744]
MTRILHSLVLAAVYCTTIGTLYRPVSAGGFTQLTQSVNEATDTNQNFLQRLFRRAVAAVAPKQGDVNYLMNAIAVNAPKAAQQGTETILETVTGIAPKQGDVNYIMNAIAVNSLKGQQGTTTIVETITGIAPATGDPESLMKAIAAKIADEAQSTKTVTEFVTDDDNDDDDDDDDSDEHTRHHKSRSSKTSSRHKGESSTRRGDDDDDDEEPDMGDFDLIVMSSSSSTLQSGYTPCPSYMTLDYVTITFVDASQCAISDNDTDNDSDMFASPEPTPDLGDLDNECWMVVTRGSQTLTYSNADACIANSMLPGSISESEPNSELGGLDDPDFDSSSESEYYSLTVVARPVMGSLGYNIYESTGDALICSASTS